MKFLKWVIGIILVFIIALFILVKIASEDRPESNPTPEADVVANRMLETIGKPQWDSLHLLRWTFMGEHHYVWNKKQNIAEIKWDSHRVILDLNTLEAKAWTNEESQSGEVLAALKQTAWEYWCNDSFWMFAPFKVFDPGTSRTLINEVEHGTQGLLVTYDSGGVTPGDAYLWHLDDDFRPVGYKMWVKIIPVGGLYIAWSDWVTLNEGIQLAQIRKGSMLTLKMDNLKAGENYKDLGLDGDPFSY